MYIIRAIYPHGSHTVMLNDQALRFANKQDAATRAEILNAEIKKSKDNQTSYIVVEDTL